MPHVEHLLAQYHDRELGPGRRYKIEQHLAGCPDCRAKLEELRRLSGVLGSCKLPDTLTNAAVFRSRVLLRLPRRRHRPVRSVGLGWLSVPVSLVCVLVVVQGLWFALSSVGVLARVAGWAGVELSAISALLPSTLTGSGAALDYVIGSPLCDVVRIGGFLVTYLLLLVVFVLYAGWVGVLVRSVQRVGALEGEQNGSL